jgi:type II secretory pathway component PulJ
MINVIDFKARSSRFSKSSRGFTLISLLVSLSLASLVLAYAIPAIHALTQKTLAIKKEAEAQRLAARLSAIASQIMQDADTHRLDLGLRVHKGGTISYLSGAAHPVMRGSSTTRPGTSDAITVLALESAAALIPRSTTPIQSSYNWFEGCSASGGKTPSSPHRSFLAISAEGVAEVVAQSFGCSSNGCCSGLIGREESLITHSLDHKRTLLLVPISQLLTYYVSEKMELRLFQQVGSSVIENQPLFADVPPLSISLSTSSTIGISITSEKGALKRYPIHQYGSLTRASYDSLLRIVNKL